MTIDSTTSQPGTKSEGRSAPPNPYGQELREKVAQEICTAITEKDGYPITLPADLIASYVDERRVDFGEVADRVFALLAALQHTEAGG